MVLNRDVNNVFGLLESHAVALLRVEAIHRKSAKFTFGIADIGDGELQVAGTAVFQHPTEESFPYRVAPLQRRSENSADAALFFGSPALSASLLAASLSPKVHLDEARRRSFSAADLEGS